MPHRRDQIEQLTLRAEIWESLLAIFRLSHKIRFPGRKLANDLGLLFCYGCALVTYSKGKLVHVPDIARDLQMSRETARRNLNKLVVLELLEREGNAYRPSPHVEPVLGLEATAKAIRRACHALGC